MGTKTIKSTPTSEAGIVVSDNAIRQSAKEENSVTVSDKGTTISGPVSFVSGTNHIRVGGLCTFNDKFKLSLPSTYANPTPTLLIDPPIKQFQSLMKEATLMIGLLGSISGI